MGARQLPGPTPLGALITFVGMEQRYDRSAGRMKCRPDSSGSPTFFVGQQVALKIPGSSLSRTSLSLQREILAVALG